MEFIIRNISGKLIITFSIDDGNIDGLGTLVNFTSDELDEYAEKYNFPLKLTHNLKQQILKIKLSDFNGMRLFVYTDDDLQEVR